MDQKEKNIDINKSEYQTATALYKAGFMVAAVILIVYIVFFFFNPPIFLHIALLSLVFLGVIIGIVGMKWCFNNHERIGSGKFIFRGVGNIKGFEINCEDLLELSPDAIATIDKNGRFTFVNNALCSTVKKEKEDLIDSPFIQLIHPGSRKQVARYYHSRISGNTDVPPVYEAIAIGSDDEQIPIEINSTLLRIEGEPQVFAIIRNLSASKRGEKKFKELQEFTEALVGKSPIAVAVFKNDGQLLLVNRKFIDIWGIESEELVIGKINILKGPWLQGLKTLDFKSAFEGNPTNWQMIDVQITSQREDITRKVSSTLIPIFNENEEVIRVVLLGMDMSDRVAYQREISEKEEHFRAVFDNADESIIISSVNGRIIKANPAAVSLTGYSQTELYQMTIHDLFDIDDKEISMRQISWLIMGGKVHYQSHFRLSSGKVVNVDVSASLTEVSGEKVIINIVRDLSERDKLISKITQTQKMESLGAMAEGIAHDFNNILEGILGAAELSQVEVKDNSEIKSNLDLIIDMGQRGARLTRQLLNYARQAEVETEFLDINRVIEDALEILSHTLDKRINLRLVKAQNIPPIIGDRTKLEQVIVNLALNAQEAMPDGGELTIRTDKFSANENFCKDRPGISPGLFTKIVLQDTGVGMNSELIKKAFDPLFTTKERGQGAGMGLATVHSTIKSHGGAIDLNSNIGQGTTIEIYLPAVDSEYRNYHQRSPLESTVAKDKTIMVVDDEEIIRNVIGNILIHLGYQVVKASNGKEALEYLTDNNGEIDAILLDVMMPGLSGIETYQRLKEYWPNIPVIVVTGRGDQKQNLAMITGGVVGFVEKPFKAAQIAEKLQEVFEKD